MRETRYITHDSGQDRNRRSNRGRQKYNDEERPGSYPSPQGPSVGTADRDDYGRRRFGRWWLLLLAALLALLVAAYFLFWPDGLAGVPGADLPEIGIGAPLVGPGAVMDGDDGSGDGDGSPGPGDSIDRDGGAPADGTKYPVYDFEAGVITIPIEWFPDLALEWCKDFF